MGWLYRWSSVFAGAHCPWLVVMLLLGIHTSPPKLKGTICDRFSTPLKELVRAFDARKVLDLAQVKAALGTPVKMTALRQLRQLDYHSSYSHAGRYYTLERIARWDGHGLWSSTGIRFSRHGTLVETMAQLVDAAAGGWVSAELEDVLGVRVHAALLSLYRRGRVRRHQIGGEYLYVSVHDGSAQLAHRQQQVQAEAVSFMGLGLEARFVPILVETAQAPIVTF